MISLTSRRRGRPGVRAGAVLVAAVILVGAAGCTGGDDDGGDADGGSGGSGSSGSDATDAAPVATVTTLSNLGKGVSDAKRERVKAGVNAVVDPFFDDGFLGDFPRSDYAAAFAGFTPGAAADAQERDLALLTNQPIADQIDGATATRRRVRLEVFLNDGRPRGATAAFVLDFDTQGSLEESRRVTGRLYLAKDKGEWRVFGYDVDEAVPR